MMEGQDQESTDGSSIKPVSSLRSHFENMIKSRPVPNPPITPNSSARGALAVSSVPLRQWEDNLAPRPRTDGRISLDLPRSNTQHGSPSLQAEQNTSMTPVDETRPSPRATPKLRPLSLGPLSPPRSPPLVTIESPRSPLGHDEQTSSVPSSARSHSPTEDSRRQAVSRPHSPLGNVQKPFKLPSRAATPLLDARQTPTFATFPSPTIAADPRKVIAADKDSPTRATTSTGGSSAPPPINRAGKPKIFQTPTTRKISESLAAPNPSADEEERISPFSTPPSEPEDFAEHDPAPPPIPEHSKPRPRPLARDGYFSNPTTQHHDREILPPPSPTRGRFLRQTPKQADVDDLDQPQGRPVLPPRHSAAPPKQRSRSPNVVDLPPPELPLRPSMDGSSTPSTQRQTEMPRSPMDSTSTSSTLVNDPRPLRHPRRILHISPQPQPIQSHHSNLNFHNHHSKATPEHSPLIPASKHITSFPPPPPPPPPPSAPSLRGSNEFKREPPPRELRMGRTPADSEDDESEQSPERNAMTLNDFPDSSQANRRPPRFKQGPHEIHTKYETKLFAICGEIICTTGYVTKVWNVVTGELLMSISHADTVKATAVAFKPATAVEDEGKRIWLGTNTGELHELDIPTQSPVRTKHGAHARFSIIRIHRHASDMWTLDDDGKLLVWPPGDDGIPSLELSPYACRVPSGASYYMIVGSQLWIAFGKEIWVYQYHVDTFSTQQVLQKPLFQPGVGDVTSGALVASQPDRIYFGHNDGKVTIYDRKDYSCLGVISVSLYKIGSLVGVGDYLWAGFNTGMIYVYDMKAHPWKVKKDWKAHDGLISGISVDGTSMWKLDRLQVVSIGMDGLIRIWDGMLTEDWLEVDMQEHDFEFCSFRETTALVLTWNAGASKPSSLRNDERDANFFRDFLRSVEPPDICVFGFQELVDLEDKKVTAKSLFKSSKKKHDNPDHERMSHQYRAWKDHLARSLDENMPSNESYTLLHTANLVGLFTCIFVKSSVRSQIRDVEAAQVKLGMGGLHGNKGALIVRFMLDDSSMCFINCHLAAGQRQTTHRNNNVAAIMEATALPAQLDAVARADMFVGGGDGSMVLDHEICILNGDLNYRIDSMPRDTVISAIRNNNLAKLLERDQLLLSRKRNPGFRLRAFEEKPITFDPTYKYDVSSDTYDTSEKKRSPAWCDRLLYRGLGRIKMDSYRRWEVKISDHRPVSGSFRIRVKTIVPKKREAVRAECEIRFEKLQRRIGLDIKLDYLISVLGLSEKEAAKLLTKK